MKSLDYAHRDPKGNLFPLPTGKVICVGRNYVDHAKELGNTIPETPVLFMKPRESLVSWQGRIEIPTDRGACHHELELAILIAKPLSKATPKACVEAIAGVSLGLDLTLRDVQNQLKSKAQPWEMAKAFDGSCPIGPWIPLPDANWLSNARFHLKVNGELRQQGDSTHMIWPVIELLEYVSRYFTLSPGDVLLTGTPAGVGVLNSEDRLEAELTGLWHHHSKVVFCE